MADRVTITNVFESDSVDPSRQGKQDTYVNYVVDHENPDVGRRGPMLEIFPTEGFNLERAKNQILDKEREHAKVVGQTFEL